MLAVFGLAACTTDNIAAAPEVSVLPANVILILVDDLGYCDSELYGCDDIPTPHIRSLAEDGTVFTAGYVTSPVCSPSRASLLTGRYQQRFGHEFLPEADPSGQSGLPIGESTLADAMRSTGYTTGMVGKWHLGDNAPHRPQDRGFQDVLWHRCGGIGQASDYWGNDYFDDTYERAGVGNMQGRFQKFEGYCTDVWFREGLRFVERNKDKPFFLYLALNAPHGPYRVPPEWAQPYEDREEVSNPNFLGMVANIDHKD